MARNEQEPAYADRPATWSVGEVAGRRDAVVEALQWYASDDSYEGGVAGHQTVDAAGLEDPDGRWIPDVGFRAAAVLHGHPLPTDAEVEDTEGLRDGSDR